jgi:ribosomal protein S12 methylthiotransferase
MSDRPPIVSLVNLGCAKNTVDSERILGQLASAGFLIAEDPAQADLCLVNTCGFIHDAREESAGVLRELQKLKQGGSLKSVVALGCLVERAQGAPELNNFLDHADATVGFQDYPRLSAILRELARRGPAPAPRAAAADGVPVQVLDKRGSGLGGAARSFTQSYADFLTAPRLRIGSPHLANLKISEGCSNFCKFCSIPYIRGVQVSRPVEDIVAEARQLVEAGARELDLIAQDTSSYGRDLYGAYRLPALLRALAGLEADVWFRLMYAFPRFLNDEMLDVLASDPRFCPYIDMPLQHIADRMLIDMGRGLGRRDTVALLDRIAAKLPGGAIRTTFIVGYPGETDAQFEELRSFVREGRFSHVGVFMYSREPRTPSAKLEDTIPLAVKKERRDVLMQEQLEVSRSRLKAQVGRPLEVMYDGPVAAGSAHPKGARGIGRTRLEAPEVDGLVFLEGRGVGRLEPGRRVRAKVTASFDYDLLARMDDD